MLRNPLGPTVLSAGNSDSRVVDLKHGPSNPDRASIIWHTQSLDEGSSRIMSATDELEVNDENHVGASSEVAALHSSFDAALLESDHTDNSIFSDKHSCGSTPRTKSWDEHEMNKNAEGELSGKKHLRQHAPSAELFPPGTVRKLPRRSTANATPGKPNAPPPGSAAKKKIGSLTPNSATRRRQRTPFHHRKSPVRKGSNRMPPTATPASKLLPPQALTPTGDAQKYLPTTAVKTSARSHNTGRTTAAETSADTDSHCTSSPSTTPFRFTSFPASLPRVNNPRTTDRSYNSPFTIKKRMTFADDNHDLPSATPGMNRSTDVGDGDVGSSRASHPLHLLSHQCRDDDGTHNSSISSWSADAGQHMAHAAPSVPPTVLEWKSPANEDDMDTDEAGNKCAQSPVHAKLFMGDDEYDYSDDEEPAHLGGTVGRTRLNFNLVLSPDAPATNENNEEGFGGGGEDLKEGKTGDVRGAPSKMDLNRTYEQRRVNSFPSSVSSTTPLHNVSGYDESATASTTAFSPSRSGGGSGPLVARLDSGHPETPEEVQIHFHLDAAQCSPIPGVLEEEPHGMLAPRFSASKSERTPNNAEINSDKLQLSALDESGGSGGSSTTSSKMRKLRPMPDISAFDTAGRSIGSARQEKSEDGRSGLTGRAPPPSPKLLCPPTPVRTPAWAHSDTPVFARTNSLIVTKVLATCPPQVLDGHSSLENSLMEDDDNASNTIEQRRASLSFSAVEEEMEDQGIPWEDIASRSNQESDSVTDPGTVPRKDNRKERDTTKLPKLPMAADSIGTEAAPAFSFSNVTATLGRGSATLKTPAPKLASGRQMPRFTGGSGTGSTGSTLSFATEFENLGELGSGTFADVFKVRSRSDNQLYAVKKNRRRFRGKRDRDMALAEVRTMQRLQSVCAETAPSSDGSSNSTEKTKKSLYLLFFFRAWQEDGYFFCQTELCCRDTCREMVDSLKSQWNRAKKIYPSLLKNLPPVLVNMNGNNDEDNVGRLVPQMTLWKICHDVSAGLSHIHSHGIVHNDIKPSNIFLVAHSRLGAMCKIGDFGMAGDVGTTEDGQEGDTLYMAPELLSSSVKDTSADIFSLGLTLYELAADTSWVLPSEGSRWHDLRSGSHVPELPNTRKPALMQLIQTMINPDPAKRPTAEKVLTLAKVNEAGAFCDEFLRDYIKDIANFDTTQERRRQLERRLSAERGQTPRNVNSDTERFLGARTPTPETVPILFTPEAK